MKNFIEHIGVSNFIALDLETTGLDPKNDKIIEISAYKFSNGLPVESFTYLINPEHPISSISTQITGIDFSMIKDKPVFKDIKKEFISFIGDYPIIGHNIIFDMNFLKVYLSEYESIFSNRMICDTFYLSKIYYYYHTSFSLASLCHKLNIEVSDSHRAEEDAKNSGLLFMEILKKIKGSNLILIQKIKSCIEKFNVPNNKLFDNVLKYIIEFENSIDNAVNSYVHINPSFSYKNTSVENLSIEKIFQNNGLIEKKLEDYEVRTDQIQFAEDILTALSGEYSLVAEAGAGLGKSYAYLFSSLLHGKENKQQVVISTNTHSLQHQLFSKDIPFVVDVLNQDCRATIVKGINNYICLTRLDELLNDAERKLNRYEAMELLSLCLWIQNTQSGDISECVSFNYKYYNHLWLLINARSEFCLTYKCNRYDGCYYGYIKKQAKQSDLLIVNHSMMVSYQDKQDSLVSDNAICIVDECHNFPSICQKQSSKSVSIKKIKEYKESYLKILKMFENKKRATFKIQSKDLLEIIDDLIDSFQKFSENFYSLNVVNQFKSEYIQNISINRDNIFPSNDGSAQNYLVTLNKLILGFRDHRLDLDNIKEDISKNTLQEFDFLLSNLENLYLISDIIINNTDNSINWFSYRHMDNYLDSFSFNLAPENLQDITHNIFSSFHTTIFCSATLSTSSNFDFFIRQMGFNDLVYQDEIKLNKYPSPYYYSDQTKLFILNTETEIDFQSHIKKVASDIFDIHLKVNKRILVLCTSFKQIYDFERVMNSLSKDKENNFLFQKKGVSRDLLLSEYLQCTNSVLFGTNTFWEGIDLPKDKLEILIIFKLPFSNPKDPFIKANIDYYNSNNLDAFNQYQLQDAIIKLKQGFGRLIRGYDDMGICIITDPRLTRRRYGRYIIDSLPLEPIYYSSPSIITHEIENFLS